MRKNQPWILKYTGLHPKLYKYKTENKFKLQMEIKAPNKKFIHSIVYFFIYNLRTKLTFRNWTVSMNFIAKRFSIRSLTCFLFFKYRFGLCYFLSILACQSTQSPSWMWLLLASTNTSLCSTNHQFQMYS